MQEDRRHCEQWRSHNAAIHQICRHCEEWRSRDAAIHEISSLVMQVHTSSNYLMDCFVIRFAHSSQ